MPRNATIDSVQINGWTVHSVRCAVSALSELVTTHPHQSEQSALACEVIRWLRCAVEQDPQGLADYFDCVRLSAKDTSSWGQLQELLAKDQPLDALIAGLRESCADPVSSLCMLLDETVPADEEWRDIDPRYRRAVEVLLAIGMPEGFTYLTTHVNLLCWDGSDGLQTLAQEHHAMMLNAAVGAWPNLGWEERTTLMLAFDESGLSTAPLLDMLFATDGNTLPYERRYRFVEALAYSEDARAESAIQRLIDMALDEISRSPSEEAIKFVSSASYWLVNEMEKDTTPQQRQRAAELGLDIRWLRAKPPSGDNNSSSTVSHN